MCAKLIVQTACIKGAFAAPLWFLLLLIQPLFSHCTQAHDLHLYGSAVDSALRDSMWEVQTYVHFQDNEGVTVTIKPEHRVEDVLALVCKVMNFAVEILPSREGLLMVYSSAFGFVGGVQDSTFYAGEHTNIF
jgi:hypothetical protein